MEDGKTFFFVVTRSSEIFGHQSLRAGATATIFGEKLGVWGMRRSDGRVVARKIKCHRAQDHLASDLGFSVRLKKTLATN